MTCKGVCVHVRIDFFGIIIFGIWIPNLMDKCSKFWYKVVATFIVFVKKVHLCIKI